jgi:hypothetical protein
MIPAERSALWGGIPRIINRSWNVGLYSGGPLAIAAIADGKV